MLSFSLSFLSVFALTVVNSVSATAATWKAYSVAACRGVDFNTLSSAEQENFAAAIQTSFNRVHGPNEVLWDTKWDAVIPDAFPGYSEMRLGWPEGGGSNSHLECHLCPDDDDNFDDTLPLSFSQTFKPDLVEWAADLTTELQSSGLTGLQEATACSVKIDFTRVAMVDTAVRVQCQNVDWDVLTTSEQQFAASQMQNSFNNVHSVDEDMMRLQNMKSVPEVGKVNSLIDVLIGFAWPSKYGYFTGSFSADVDAKVDVPAATLRRTNTKDVMAFNLWETEFEKLLHRGPFSALSRAADCRIEMKVVDSNMD